MTKSILIALIVLTSAFVFGSMVVANFTDTLNDRIEVIDNI